MDVTLQTLAALGFDEIRAALAARCRTEMGRYRARHRPLLPDADAVNAELHLCEEARSLKNEPLPLPIGGLPDIRPSLERALKGAMLEPTALLEVCQSLYCFERTAEIVAERKERLPGLADIGTSLPVLPKLAARIDRSIEPSGDISDRASSELRDARDAARALHRKIRARLDSLLQDGQFNESLRESYYSVRNDRYVVPVKSSHQREVDGIVHNASQSGQTLFVEPTELIGLGNELAIAQAAVLEEERKVLLELSLLVGREGEALAAGVDAIARFDELEAAATLANDLDAHSAVLERADGPLSLRNLRHPRLVLKDTPVVANDVELHDARALVISGPNAGGKTVTLTAVGLCALMTRAGLPIPADHGSRIPLFDELYSAIGDQQNIDSGLSTFSAHVTLLKDITYRAQRGALILIDEIAADTDPKEGAAIATAVLEVLIDRGALVLVTTHLEELKALAQLDSRFVNARVGFDSKRMSPTYRLQMGFAGASSAIDVARRVGLDESICQRAHALATNSGGALSRALAAAEEERRSLLEQQEQAQRHVIAAREAQAQAEAERLAAQKYRADQELHFRKSLRAELEFAKTHIRSLIQTLEVEKGEAALKKAKAASAEITARINEQTVAERNTRAAFTDKSVENEPLDLKIGARVRHRTTDVEVEIIELLGDTALVIAGSLKMRVALDELGPSTPSRTQKPSRQIASAKPSSAPPIPLAGPTVDVRGERIEDAMRRIEQFLDRCVQSGESSSLIIHGHGTGAIKRELREMLRQSPYAKSFRPGENGEGGDGVTVVFF